MFDPNEAVRSTGEGGDRSRKRVQEKVNLRGGRTTRVKARDGIGARDVVEITASAMQISTGKADE